MIHVTVDRNSGIPLTRQLCEAIRNAVASGTLPGGAPLPPSREAAKLWQVGRNVVVQSYEQLCAEGWLRAKVGDGTRVSEGIGLSSRARGSAAVSGTGGNGPVPKPDADCVDFDRAAGQVDAERFPMNSWTRCSEQALREILAEGGGYPPIDGDARLRRAVCLWLRRNRGFDADPDLVAITSGAGAACAALARTLRRRPGSAGAAAAEDPGLPALRKVLAAADWKVLPVPVDREGARPPRAPADLLLVAPSHQFPTGAILSAGRRAAIIDWAAESGAYVIEDDYDSEFRYEGAPVPPMASLDPERVVYIGTFSKLLFPGIRLGFAVLPPALREGFREEVRAAGLRPPAHGQRTLARFMEEGLMDRHIVAMRKVYRGKRGILVAAVGEAFGASARISGDAAGLFLAAGLGRSPSGAARWPPRGVKARTAGEYAAARIEDPDRFILGYGGLSEARIREGIARLRTALGSADVGGSIRGFEEGAY